MNQEKSLLLRLIGGSPICKIIDFLIENKGLDFSKKEIAEGAGISKASLFVYWLILEQQFVVRATRKFGKTTLYTLNSESAVVKKLLELETVMIETAMVHARKRVYA